eukprot:jgi/Bigna1/89253/estExt_fgenesh1_pg.C_460043
MTPSSGRAHLLLKVQLIAQLVLMVSGTKFAKDHRHIVYRNHFLSDHVRLRTPMVRKHPSLLAQRPRRRREWIDSPVWKRQNRVLEHLQCAANGDESNCEEGEPSSSPSSVPPPAQNEVDLFRDTGLRYMGYANEAGEAFRAFIGASGVLVSYAIASGYVVSDSIYQGYMTAKHLVKWCILYTGSSDDICSHNKYEMPLFIQKKKDGATDGNSTKMRIAMATAESLVWQSLASVIIPGFTINRCVALAHFLLASLFRQEVFGGISTETTEKLDHWGPTLFGLAMIPVIVRPIDSTVEKTFERHVRPAIKKFLDEYEAREIARLEELK